MGYYVWDTHPEKPYIEYEGRIYYAPYATVGLEYPILFTEEHAYDPLTKTTRASFREATEDELAKGIIVNSELIRYLPKINRNNMHFLTEKQMRLRSGSVDGVPTRLENIKTKMKEKS